MHAIDLDSNDVNRKIKKTSFLTNKMQVQNLLMLKANDSYHMFVSHLMFDLCWTNDAKTPSMISILKTLQSLFFLGKSS